MKKETQKSKILLKSNILFSISAIIINIVFFYVIPNSSKNFFEYSLLINGFFLFIYYNDLFTTMRKKLVSIKKETEYASIPLRTFSIFLIFIGILFFNIFTIYSINKEAVDILFVSNLFTNTISLHLPLIVLFIFVYVITPAIIIPHYDNTKHKKANKILTIFFILLLAFLVFEITKTIISTKETDNKTTFDLEQISYEYNDKFLKYIDINEHSKKEIKEDNAIFPFSYTTEEQIAFSYEEAEDFCTSLNAKVSSISEIYNIQLNKFEMRGEKYYWTRNNAGRIPLLLHFKDLNYEVIKPDRNTKANVVCTTTQNSKYLKMNKIEKAIKPIEQDINEFETNINATETAIDGTKVGDSGVKIPSEFVGFDIKFVPEHIFNKAIEKGYIYKRDIKVNPINQVRNISNISQVKAKGNEIKLCHFPFILYPNFTIEDEKEIWKQNFCSPNFEIIDAPETTKSQYEKDSYCISHGGRLPNISELAGIIKSTQKINKAGRYWVKNTINKNGKQTHIYLDKLNQININARMAINNETASVICIKDKKNKSNIISNFSSKFYNENGKIYAKQICPKCDYYEMPDMVLNQ